MHILSWSASCYYARPRSGALLVAMLVLACALSYTRAHAQAPAKISHSSRSAEEIVAALRKAKGAELAPLEQELLSKGGEAVKPMIALMSAKRGQDRIMVMIANLGEKAPPALVALLPDDKLRPMAARALAHAAGTYSGNQAAELLDCMNRWPEVLHYCGIALGRGMSPKQARWIPRFAAGLNSSNRNQRLYVVLALRQIGVKTPGVREALLTVVSDDDEEIRRVVRAAGVRPAPKPVAKPAGGRTR